MKALAVVSILALALCAAGLPAPGQALEERAATGECALFDDNCPDICRKGSIYLNCSGSYCGPPIDNNYGTGKCHCHCTYQ